MSITSPAQHVVAIARHHAVEDLGVRQHHDPQAMPPGKTQVRAMQTGIVVADQQRLGRLAGKAVLQREEQQGVVPIGLDKGQHLALRQAGRPDQGRQVPEQQVRHLVQHRGQRLLPSHRKPRSQGLGAGHGAARQAVSGDVVHRRGQHAHRLPARPQPGRKQAGIA